MAMNQDDFTVLRPADAARLLGISKATLYSWSRSRPDFPRKIKIGPRSSGWLRSELLAWLERQRDAA